MQSRIAVVTLVVLMLLVASSSVWACKGKKVLFEDNFATLDPAWGEPTKNRNVKDGKLIVQPALNTSEAVLNQANVFEDLDACIKVRLVKSDDPSQAGGLIFWGKDYSSYYALKVSADGHFKVARLVGNHWIDAVASRENAAVKKGIGQVNQLRVVTKGNQATVYINDEEVVSFKGQPPEGGSLVGVIGSSPPEESQVVWEFSDLKITNTN
jgi:hypothetical protein